MEERRTGGGLGASGRGGALPALRVQTEAGEVSVRPCGMSLLGWTSFRCEAPDGRSAVALTCHDGWDRETADLEALLGPDAAQDVDAALQGWEDHLAEVAGTGLGELLPPMALARAGWLTFDPVAPGGWEGLCARAALDLPAALRELSGPAAHGPSPDVAATLAHDYLGTYASWYSPEELGLRGGPSPRAVATAACAHALADLELAAEDFGERAGGGDPCPALARPGSLAAAARAATALRGAASSGGRAL